jgi:hypothetical protein
VDCEYILESPLVVYKSKKGVASSLIDLDIIVSFYITPRLKLFLSEGVK